MKNKEDTNIRKVSFYKLSDFLKTMIYHEEPENFSPSFNAVGCFMEHDGEILLLHRQNHKPQGDTWGIPGGKAENGEELPTAMRRELLQETGHVPETLAYFGKVFIKYPALDFIYHIFHTTLANKPEVRINPGEHKAYGWFYPQAALSLPLIMDMDACIRFYKI